LEKTPSESPELQELAARVRSSLASITKTHSDEFAVRCLMRSRALFIIAGFFLATAACAQSLPDESDSLATALSDRAASIAPTAKLRPRLSATARTAPAPKSSAAVDSGKNRRKPLEKLGVNKHRFVHCGLANGKVRTEIRGNGYMLKDGMLISQWIRFTDLQAAPRPVPAAGTRTALRDCKPRLRLLPADDLRLGSQYTQASKIVS